MFHMTEPKKPAKKSKPQRTGVSVNTWLPDELYAAMAEYIEESRPRTTAKAVMVTALEDFLKAAGKWPPRD